MSEPVILDCRNLHVSARSDHGTVKILEGVTLELRKGEVLGIAGESGSGKSTLIRTILGILPRQASVDNGAIIFQGSDLLAAGASRRELRRLIGFIPQDPYLALNPHFTIGAQMMEILRWNGIPGEEGRTSRRALRARHRAYLIDRLKDVGLPDPEGAFDRYPHQFSGGQRQRILIATALGSRPQVLLADEPTTALDVTTQGEILLLLQSLIEEYQMSMLFVTHDFGVISQLCDRVAVMHSGNVVEIGDTRKIIDDPTDDYTRKLIAAHPDRSGFDFSLNPTTIADGA